jgi:hypothetical protein
MNDKWIPADNYVPAQGVRVLAFSARDNEAHVMEFDGEDWHEADGAGWRHDVTHWTPLPASPLGSAMQ